MRLMTDLDKPAAELASANHLIHRFDADVLAMYNEMQRLEIFFNNLKGSWTAISQVHKIIKLHEQDKT